MRWKRALWHRDGAGADSADPEGSEFESDDAPRLSCNRIEGADIVQDVVMIDQTPIGRTPRSNPVTYIKGFDIIRGLFAATPAAEKRGYTAGHFSFNVPGGRCEVCQGDGTVTVEMQFLADVELVCDECKGTRFKSSILDIKYKGLNCTRSASVDCCAKPLVSSKKRAAWCCGLNFWMKLAWITLLETHRHNAVRWRGSTR